MARVSRIAVHPIKALDPIEPERVSITEVGGLEGDRAYAIVDADGEYVNGKRTADVHPLRAEVDPEANRVTLEERDGQRSGEFHLDSDRDTLETWLSEYFGYEVHLETGSGGSQTDSVVISNSTAGPTVISEATLREVASWFDGIPSEEMRRRLRPNLVVEDVPAFWEDRLVTNGGRQFRIGDVTLKGTRPIPRCVVPTRHPETGTEYEDFQATFVRKREETLPEWADRSAFDGHFYKVMVGTRIPESERGGELAVGDEVQLVESPPEP